MTRLAESLYGNEALTAGLRDEAAERLLSWAVDCGEAIVRATEGLDEARAEEVLAPRLKALRRMCRTIRNWAVEGAHTEPQQAEAWLAEIVKQASLVYGPGFVPPESSRLDRFLRAHRTAEPIRLIEGLRTLLEESSAE